MKKILPFPDVFYHLVFLYFPTERQARKPAKDLKTAQPMRH